MHEFHLKETMVEEIKDRDNWEDVFQVHGSGDSVSLG